MEHTTQVINRPAIRWILLARVILGTLFLASALVLKYGGAERYLTFQLFPVYVYVVVTYLSSTVLGILAKHLESFPGAVTSTLTALDLALVFGLTTYTGGSSSPFLFLYLFIIIGAAILTMRRGALTLTALSMIAIGTTLLIEYYGKLPTQYMLRLPRTTQSQMLVTAFYNITAFYVVGILSSYLAARLRSAGEEIDRLDLDISILKGLHERIIDNVASGLLTLDDQGRALLANRQAERILGRPIGRIRGLLASEFMSGLVLAEGANDTRMELKYVHPDGSERFLGYSISPIRLDARKQGFVVVFQDLTRMKELETGIKQQEKLAALGSMAAGIAHEIRNPLGSISGSLQLLRQNIGFDDESAQLAGIALREIDRLNGLVNDFLLYARPGRHRPEVIAVHSIVEEIILGIKRDTRVQTVNLENRLPRDMKLLTDQTGLRQILLNLTLNAAQAGATRVVFREGTPNANWLVFEINDDGKGIPESALEHLGEPFFTTRPDGVGLGLATVYRIMGDNGGSIVTQSKPGNTTFRLLFPKEFRTE